jgi:hypothetical protein
MNDMYNEKAEKALIHMRMWKPRNLKQIISVKLIWKSTLIDHDKVC